MKSKTQITELIKRRTIDLGFSAVGISKAGFLEKESQQLKKWLQKGFHGEMSYMENHFEKRVDPRKLVKGAKSVMSVLYNYYPKETQAENTYKISKYAYGKDYHIVVKEKLYQLLAFIKKETEEVSGRAFVDSAPVMDKVWAARSGLGWIGKNTNLISKEYGSFVFIGELIIDLELEYDTPVKDYCGNCTKCIDACPTSALGPYQLDARKCISYLTIEKKGNIPEEFKGKWNDWIFGCDICQDVCPWNKNPVPTKEESFLTLPEWFSYTKTNWQKITELEFNVIFIDSPIQRTGYAGLKRNLTFF